MPLRIKGEVAILISPQVKIRLRERALRTKAVHNHCAKAADSIDMSYPAYGQLPNPLWREGF